MPARDAETFVQQQLSRLNEHLQRLAVDVISLIF
jgi:hypothetical protein